MCVSSAYCCYSKESPFFFCIYLLFPSSSSVASYFCSLLDKQLDWKPFVFLFPPPLQYYCLLGSVPRVEKIIIRAPVFILFLKKGKKKDKNYLKYDISFQLIVAPVESEHITWCLSLSLSTLQLTQWGGFEKKKKKKKKSFFLVPTWVAFCVLTVSSINKYNNRLSLSSVLPGGLGGRYYADGAPLLACCLPFPLLRDPVWHGGNGCLFFVFLTRRSNATMTNNNKKKNGKRKNWIWGGGGRTLMRSRRFD
jgi:hypothetical protein